MRIDGQPPACTWARAQVHADRIAFHSNADLLGTNGDGSYELFLASCPVLGAVEVPAVSPAGLGALALLLGLAAASAFRRLNTPTP